MGLVEEIIGALEIFAADMENEWFESEPDKIRGGLGEGEERVIYEVVADFEPLCFVLFARTSPEVDTTRAGRGSVVVRKLVDGVEKWKSALIDIAFFAFVEFCEKRLFVVGEIALIFGS